MVLGDVEHSGRGRLEIRHALELEARQLDHPHLRELPAIELFRQRLQQRRSDVAGHSRLFPGALDQLAGQRRHRRLAVGAGDRQHRRRVVAIGLQVGQRLGKQLQFAGNADPALAGRGDHAGHLQRREARTAEHRLRARAFEQRRIERAADEPGLRQVLAQLRQLRRLLAGVGDGQPGAAARDPARHGVAGRAEAQHQHGLVLQRVHPASARRPERGAGPFGRQCSGVAANVGVVIIEASRWTGRPGTAAW